MKLLILITFIAVPAAHAQHSTAVKSTLSGAPAVPPPSNTPPPIGIPVYVGSPQPTQVMPHQQLQLPEQEEPSTLQKAMQVLNPILQNMMGGGAGNPLSNPYERMAGTEGDYGSGWSSYNSGNPNATAEGLNAGSARGTAKIVDPFKRHFPMCTEKVGLGKCQFVFLGIWGDMAHRVRPSCHNSGEAMDVGLPFNCSNGGRIDARDPRALEVARCMANNTGGELGVIFQDRREGPNMFPGSPPGAHNGHMHIQLRFCNRVTGG